MKRLAVYLFDILVGYLEQDISGKLSFKYDDVYIMDGKPISQSLPLSPKIFGHQEVRPFFAGLLPEDTQRKTIAKNLGVSEKNDFAILDNIGGECAGAITLLEPGLKPATTIDPSNYRIINENELRQHIGQLPRHPLLAGAGGVRLSLAGAQSKMAVLKIDNQIALTLQGAPSSHIIKPPILNYEDTVFNEGFCLMIAKKLGLYVVDVEIDKAIDIPYLLVKRYDRYQDNSGGLQRLHQEDFCQALAISPELKYQNEGGPTLKQCFDLVRKSTTRPSQELMRLLDAILFTILVGNNDAHGKNYSLIYGKNSVELAPIYDVICTVVYPDLASHFAMKLVKKDNLADLYPRHWDRFAHEVGLGSPQVRKRLRSMVERLPAEARDVQQEFTTKGHNQPILRKIVDVIEQRTQLVLNHNAFEQVQA